MGKNDNKRCPQCGGSIDYFGSCRRCGREWSEKLEDDEQAVGKKEGEQFESKVKPPKKTRTRNKNTKTSAPRDENDKFALWRIDADNDGDVEITRKRSLMRLDSRKTYNQMGLSLRAHRAQKDCLQWLSRLWEFLSEDEKAALTPTLEHLKRGFADLTLVAQQKVNDAARMELEIDKEHKAARTARMRILNEQAQARKDAANKAPTIQPGQDTEGFAVPDLATIDPKALATLTPEELMELAKAKLSNLDQEKALRKRSERTADENPEE
jgi:hypothetical protein